MEEDAKTANLKVDIDNIASCARVDAKTQDRDMQMKYDIAKNDDGPLRKTMKAVVKDPPARLDKANDNHGDDTPTAERYPAFDERLLNVESHLAVRYGMNFRNFVRKWHDSKDS